MTQRTARAHVVRESKRLSASLEYDSTGIHYEVRIEAPTGYTWRANGAHNIVSATYGAYDWIDPLERMLLGVEPCADAPECEYCNGEESK